MADFSGGFGGGNAGVNWTQSQAERESGSTAHMGMNSALGQGIAQWKNNVDTARNSFKADPSITNVNPTADAVTASSFAASDWTGNNVVSPMFDFSQFAEDEDDRRKATGGWTSEDVSSGLEEMAKQNAAAGNQYAQDVDNINNNPDIKFDFMKANEALLQKQAEKDRFEQSMKDVAPVAKSEFERLQNTPGTKEYEEKQKNIKLGAGAAELGTREADIVRSAADQYVKMAGENVAGALVGGAFGKLLGKGFNLLPNNMKMGIAKVISKGADKALGQTLSKVGDKLLNASAPATQKVLGQVFDTVGRNVANLATGVGTTAASAGVVGTRDIDKDMWSNAIDNVGLGSTKLGQWMKEKLSSAPKTEEAQEQVAQELMDMVESDPTVLQEVTEILNTMGSAPDAVPTNDPRYSGVDPVTQALSDRLGIEINKEAALPDNEKSEGFFTSRMDEYKRIASEFGDRWAEASGLGDRIKAIIDAGQQFKEATLDGKADPKSTGNFRDTLKDLLMTAFAVANPATIPAVVAMQFFRMLRGQGVPFTEQELFDMIYGTQPYEKPNKSNEPNMTREELDYGTGYSKKDSGQATYNKGLTAVSDEDCKKYIRTMVRGQPHVRNLAKKLTREELERQSKDIGGNTKTLSEREARTL